MTNKNYMEGYYLGPIRSLRYPFGDTNLLAAPYGAHRKPRIIKSRATSHIIRDMHGNRVELSDKC